MKRAVFVMMMLSSGCGVVNPDAFDATPADGPVDASVDASVDARPPPPPGQELTAGGGRITSTTYTLEVQLGHGLEQRASQGTSFHLESSTVIKP